MNDEKNKPLLVPLSDVQEKTAEWLVPGYMPRGQINIWAGDLDEAAKAAGISKNTLGRAKTKLRDRNILGMKSVGYGQDKAFYSFLIANDFS